MLHVLVGGLLRTQWQLRGSARCCIEKSNFMVIAFYFVGVICWFTPPRFKPSILILQSLTITQSRDSSSSQHDSETVHSMPPVIQDYCALLCLSRMTNLNVCVTCNWKIMMNIRRGWNNNELPSSLFHTSRSSCIELPARFPQGFQYLKEKLALKKTFGCEHQKDPFFPALSSRAVQTVQWVHNSSHLCLNTV